MVKINTQSQALEYLYKHISSKKEFIFPKGIGVERTLHLLSLLGNPQNKLKVIHIAGTSGKGSTAYFVSSILTGLGFKVGLSVSPHLLDIKERFQINNKLISNTDFCYYLNEIIPMVEKTSITKFGAPTYFEILVSLAYYIFDKKHIDYAVMETGLGGTFDGTNVVNTPDKIAIITKIGHDHTAILGKTLDKIAAHKAGIIQSGNSVITTSQNSRALMVIKNAAIHKKAKLYLVDGNNLKNVLLTPSPCFDFSFLNIVIPNINLAMLGSFQIQNCSLALAAVVLLGKRDGFSLDIKKIRSSLTTGLFQGRMQKLKIKDQDLIIDGAHNPQKMGELVKNLKIYYPNQKFTFLIGFKRGKDYRKILHYVVPVAEKIIITSFFNQTKSQSMSLLAEDPVVISKILDHMNFKDYVIYKNSKEALKALLEDKKSIGVVTGSLYLLSEIYPLLPQLNPEVVKSTG